MGAHGEGRRSGLATGITTGRHRARATGRPAPRCCSCTPGPASRRSFAAAPAAAPGWRRTVGRRPARPRRRRQAARPATTSPTLAADVVAALDALDDARRGPGRRLQRRLRRPAGRRRRTPARGRTRPGRSASRPARPCRRSRTSSSGSATRSTRPGCGPSSPASPTSTGCPPGTSTSWSTTPCGCPRRSGGPPLARPGLVAAAHRRRGDHRAHPGDQRRTRRTCWAGSRPTRPGRRPCRTPSGSSTPTPDTSCSRSSRPGWPADVVALHRRRSPTADGPVIGTAQLSGCSSSIVDGLGQQRRQLGQLGEAGQPEPLQEQRRRRVEPAAAVGVGADLVHQPAGDQRPHDAVDPDAADRRHAGAGHRLAVGDDGEGLQRGLGEPAALPVDQVALDDGGVLLAGVEPPPLPHPAQREPGRAAAS